MFLTAPAYAGKVLVDYDASQDLVKIQASNASLTQVLAEIASKTNIIIRIDPAVEKKISTNLPPQPLRQALQKVVKGLSYVIEYKIDEKQQTVISGMKLLPKGKQDSGQLVPVSVLNARASQIHGEGDDVSGGSLNRRGNYYPGSRQSRSGQKQGQSRKHKQTTDDISTYRERSGTSSSNGIEEPQVRTKEQILETEKQDPSSSLYGQ